MRRRLLLASVWVVVLLTLSQSAWADLCWGWRDEGLSLRGSHEAESGVPDGTLSWFRHEVNDCPREHRYTFLGAADRETRVEVWKSRYGSRAGGLLAVLVLVIIASGILLLRGRRDWAIGIGLAGSLGVMVVSTAVIDLSLLSSDGPAGLSREEANQALEELKRGIAHERDLAAERHLAKQEEAKRVRIAKLSAERCARTEKCRTEGDCGYHEWGDKWDCRPTALEHCRKSELCTVRGLCHRSSGGGCVARSVDDCIASERCKTAGACELYRGRCRATRQSCLDWTACPEPGACTLEVYAGECIFQGCEVAPACADEGRCVLQDDRCVATKESCKSWANCPTPGKCEIDGVRCAITHAACKRSDKCRKFGACHAIDGICQPLDDNDCRRAEICRKEKCERTIRNDRAICVNVRLQGLLDTDPRKALDDAQRRE